MAVDVIVGLQRGDEGKGRFVDMQAEEHDIVARFNGGNNAGHTVVLPDNRELALHLVPSGISHENTMNVIGNGTLVNPVKLIEEIEDIESKDIEVTPDNLKICGGSHLILPHHIYDDVIREAGTEAQGSTKAGIAQVSSYKAMRMGARTEMIKNDPEGLLTLVYEGLKAQRPLREIAGIEQVDEQEVAEQYVASAWKIGAFVTDTVFYLNQELRKDPPAKVLAEGAQAFLLDINHGMYPYTTSTSTTSGGVATGLGIPPRFIEKVSGVVKAMPSHVGGGPFPTEEHDPQLLAQLHGDMTTIDAEVGTTTGRKRRLGHLDLPQIRRANMVNGTDEIFLSKLDWLPRYGDELKVCVAYERKGKTLSVAPDSARKLEQSTPIYETLPTWSEDIRGIRTYSELPQNAQRYIDYLENQLEVPISMIGVGPRRDEVIVR